MCNKNINDHLVTCLPSSSRNSNTRSDRMIHLKHLAFFLWFFIFPFSICSFHWRRPQQLQGHEVPCLSPSFSVFLPPFRSFSLLCHVCLPMLSVAGHKCTWLYATSKTFVALNLFAMASPFGFHPSFWRTKTSDPQSDLLAWSSYNSTTSFERKACLKTRCDRGRNVEYRLKVEEVKP